MRPSRSLFFLLAVAVLATACSSSSNPADVTEPTGPTIADLVGQWNATSMVFTNNADPSQTFDWIAAGGDGRFTTLTGGKTRNFLDLPDYDYHDQWDVLMTMNSSDMTLTAIPADTTRRVQHYAFTLSGTTLTLTNTDVLFDFTLTGANWVPATSVAVFTKTAS